MPIQLANPHLGPLLSRALRRPFEDITEEDMAALEVFPVIGSSSVRIPLNELSDFRHFKSMTTLVLAFCDFSDLSILSANKSLFRMQMTHCAQKSLEAISSLQIRELACGQTGLKSLDGIEKLPLHGLTMERNHVPNLEPLRGHTQLAYLKADGNPLADISAISQMQGVEKLSFGQCAGEDPDVFRAQLCYLKDKPKLNTLELAGNGLRDLDWLTEASELEGLQMLNLSGNIGLHDFSAISTLRNLQSLDLTVCTGLADLSFVRGLDKLERITLDLCQYIKDFSPLYGLPSLKRVDLKAVPLSSVDVIAPLIGRGVNVIYQESWIGAEVPPPNTPVTLSVDKRG